MVNIDGRLHAIACYDISKKRTGREETGVKQLEVDEVKINQC